MCSSVWIFNSSKVWLFSGKVNLNWSITYLQRNSDKYLQLGIIITFKVGILSSLKLKCLRKWTKRSSVKVFPIPESPLINLRSEYFCLFKKTFKFSTMSQMNFFLGLFNSIFVSSPRYFSGFSFSKMDSPWKRVDLLTRIEESTWEFKKFKNFSNGSPFEMR